MALFGRRRLIDAPRVRFVRLPDGGRLTVHGESHYQAALHAACGRRRAPFTDEDGCWERALQVTVALWPEPDNPYDRNAVRVDILDFGPVGHLARGDAPSYSGMLASLLARGFVGTAPGWIVRNRDAGYYAIFLHVADPTTVRRAVSGLMSQSR